MKIYPQEIKDGLEESILTNKVALHGRIFKIEESALSPEFSKSAFANHDMFSSRFYDLWKMQSILASTGENKNDDVFLPDDLFTAKETCLHKPLNMEHDCDRIVGHIFEVVAINGDFAPLENPQPSFHLLISSWLYRFKDKPESMEKMNSLIAEIVDENSPWFVSLECLFDEFDYQIDSPLGPQIIPRTDYSSFLSRSLRIYGGSGEWMGMKVGRVLRNFVFSGVGLVKNPANPYSIILTKEKKMSEPKDTSKATEIILMEVVNEKNLLVKRIEELTHAADTFAQEKTAFENTINELRAKIAEHEQNAVLAERKDFVKANLQLADDKVVEFVQATLSFDKETFEKHVTTIAGIVKSASPTTVPSAPANGPTPLPQSSGKSVKTPPHATSLSSPSTPPFRKVSADIQIVTEPTPSLAIPDNTPSVSVAEQIAEFLGVQLKNKKN